MVKCTLLKYNSAKECGGRSLVHNFGCQSGVYSRVESSIQHKFNPPDDANLLFVGPQSALGHVQSHDKICPL